MTTKKKSKEKKKEAKNEKKLSKPTRREVFANLMKERKPLTIDQIIAEMMERYPSTEKETAMTCKMNIDLLKHLEVIELQDGKYCLKKF